MRNAAAEVVIEPRVRGCLVTIHWPRGHPTKLSFSTEQAARTWGGKRVLRLDRKPSEAQSRDRKFGLGAADLSRSATLRLCATDLHVTYSLRQPHITRAFLGYVTPLGSGSLHKPNGRAQTRAGRPALLAQITGLLPTSDADGAPAAASLLDLPASIRAECAFQ